MRLGAASDANRRCAVLAERACVAAREKKSAACLAFSASFPWCSFINNVGGLQSPEGDSPLTQLSCDCSRTSLPFAPTGPALLSI